VIPGIVVCLPAVGYELLDPKNASAVASPPSGVSRSLPGSPTRRTLFARERDAAHLRQVDHGLPEGGSTARATAPLWLVAMVYGNQTRPWTICRTRRDYPAAHGALTRCSIAGGIRLESFSDRTRRRWRHNSPGCRNTGWTASRWQRFAVDLFDPATLQARNIVLANVRKAAEDNGRVFFVMYDLTGLTSVNLLRVAQIWKKLEQGGVTSSPATCSIAGHPLLGALGTRLRWQTADSRQAIVCSTRSKRRQEVWRGDADGGVPSYWRTGRLDASSDPKWQEVYRKLGVAEPWVGSAVSLTRLARTAYRTIVLEPDLAATRRMHVDYIQC